MALDEEEFDARLRERLLAEDEDTGLADDAFGEVDEADLLQMRDAIRSYKAEALDWAERQSAAMPVPRPGPMAALLDRAPRWALAGVAAVAFLAGAATMMHSTGSADTAVAAAPNAQVLATDNQLLSSVDDALTGSGTALNEHDLGLTAADLLPSAHDLQKHGQTSSSID